MKTDYTLYILKPDKRTQMGERTVSTTVWYDRDEAGMQREIAELQRDLYPSSKGYRFVFVAHIK